MPRRPAGKGAGSRGRRGRFEPIHVGDVTIFVRERPDGRYAIEARSPRGRQGFTRSDAAGMVKLVAKITAQAEAHVPVTLETAINAYLDELRSRGRRESTVGDASARLMPLTRLVDDVQELKPEIIRRRMAGEGREDSRAVKLREDKKPLPAPSVSYRRGFVARARDFARFCIGRGWLSRDPTAGIAVEGVANRGKQALTPAEARALAALLLDDSRPRATALLCALWLGLRHGEVIKARVRALDLAGDPPTWYVERATTKTARGVRTLTLPPVLAARLGPLVDKQAFDAFVFRVGEDDEEDDREAKADDREPAAQHSKTWLRKALAKACRDAKVTHVCLQGLRDTHAQLARTHGAAVDAVSVALGHEEQSTTVRSYIGEAREEAARAAEVVRLHAPGGRTTRSVRDQ